MYKRQLEKSYRDSNNYSLAVLIRHEGVQMLFAGDAVEKRTKELLKIHWPQQLDLYKVPYHGRGNPKTKELFDLLQPKIAVVTSDSADEAILEGCQQWKSELYFTSEEDLNFISDGKSMQKHE